jgi:hypothetical protein
VFPRQNRPIGMSCRFYGTDIVRKDEPKRIVYTTDRERRLELGRPLVTVPKAHQVPNIERPFAIRVPISRSPFTSRRKAEDGRPQAGNFVPVATLPLELR